MVDQHDLALLQRNLVEGDQFAHEFGRVEFDDLGAFPAVAVQLRDVDQAVDLAREGADAVAGLFEQPADFGAVRLPALEFEHQNPAESLDGAERDAHFRQHARNDLELEQTVRFGAPAHVRLARQTQLELAVQIQLPVAEQVQSRIQRLDFVVRLALLRKPVGELAVGQLVRKFRRDAHRQHDLPDHPDQDQDRDEKAEQHTAQTENRHPVAEIRIDPGAVDVGQLRQPENHDRNRADSAQKAEQKNTRRNFPDYLHRASDSFRRHELPLPNRFSSRLKSALVSVPCSGSAACGSASRRRTRMISAYSGRSSGE